LEAGKVVFSNFKVSAVWKLLKTFKWDRPHLSAGHYRYYYAPWSPPCVGA
jgi:hypothetical protein